MQFVFGVSWENWNTFLDNDRTLVDSVVDDDDGCPGFGHTCGESVTDAMCAGELGQVGRVRVDQMRSESVYDGSRQKSHEATEHDQIWSPHSDLLEEGDSPFFA